MSLEDEFGIEIPDEPRESDAYKGLDDVVNDFYQWFERYKVKPDSDPEDYVREKMQDLMDMIDTNLIFEVECGRD